MSADLNSKHRHESFIKQETFYDKFRIIMQDKQLRKSQTCQLPLKYVLVEKMFVSLLYK